MDPNGQASLLVTLSTTGRHSLRASFAGIAPFTDSTSAVLVDTVSKDATTTTAFARLVGNGPEAGISATVAPNAPGSGVPTGTVTFFDGTRELGTAQLSDGTAYLIVSSLTKGKHTITASYSGDGDFVASVSAPFVFTVP